jgi:hypothetical protein
MKRRLIDSCLLVASLANLRCEGPCPARGTDALVMGTYEVTESASHPDAVGGAIVLDGDHNAVLTYTANGVDHTVAYWWGPE